MTGADPGANSGITFGVASSAPEQLIPVASLSVTVTFDRYDVPVFDTTNDTDNGEPAVTDTPGAVFASSPLIDFTMLTPAVAGAYACAGSLSWTLRMGCPSTPKTGVPSATTGVPVAVTVSRWVAPAARPDSVPVHSVDAPGANSLTWQLRASTGSSVRITGARRTSPVFVTTNFTARGASAATDTPGALLASSLLIVLTTMMSGCAATKACALSDADTSCSGLPSAPSAGLPSDWTGLPMTLAVST